jgi:hypothetical protein
LSTKFITSNEDKKSLRSSNISKTFIRQLVDHNDIWDSVCSSSNIQENPKALSEETSVGITTDTIKDTSNNSGK